eukprot:5929476-Amphidinium_carterae.1
MRKNRPVAWRGGCRRAYGRRQCAQAHPRELGCRAGPVGRQCRLPNLHGQAGLAPSGKARFTGPATGASSQSSLVWLAFTLTYRHLVGEYPDEMPGFTGTQKGSLLGSTGSSTSNKQIKASLLGLTGNLPRGRST